MMGRVGPQLVHLLRNRSHPKTNPIVEFPEFTPRLFLKLGVYTKFFEFANFRWMSFSKRPGKNTPQCYTKPFDSLKNWNNRFFWVDDRVFSTVADWRTSAPKDQMPSIGSYFVPDVTILNTRRTPIQKQPEALLCLVGLSRRYFLGDDVYLTFLYDDDRDMDLFRLISAPNPAKVKTKTRPRVAHEGISPVGNPPYTKVAPEPDLEKEKVAMPFTEDPDSEKSASFTSMVGSPGGIYQPRWGVTNNCRLGTPAACQDMVDHIVPPGYYSELRHLPNDEFLNHCNTTLTRKVAMGSQLRLRFEQETKLLKKAVAQVARRDQRIQAREKHIKKLVALLEAKSDMKDIAEAKNVELVKELESLVSSSLIFKLATINCPSKCLLSRLKSRVKKGSKMPLKSLRNTRMTELALDVFIDVVSVGTSKGMSEGLKHGVEHGKAKVDLAAIEAYNPEADTKYVTAFHALKDLKYPLVDQLEKLNNVLIDVIMSSLYLESDFGEDAPQWIRELRPSSSQLKIPVYPEVRNPKDPLSLKKEILLENAIAANISRAKKKKKCRVVCRTHEVGSAHHARSDDVPVSVPTVAPQGLAILLADAATQTDITEDEASPKLLRSKSLPPMYNLDWP
nr:hypothetical protein [Tanacetum cinerariifolium]